MESWSRLLLLITGLMALCAHSLVNAEENTAFEPVIKPQVIPEAVEPAKIDSENFEVGAFIGILSVEDFGSNQVTGARLAYHITEDIFLESAYGKSETEKTSYERLSGSVQILTPEQRQLEYYNISLGFNVLPGEAFVGNGVAMHTALYLIGGTGKTKFAGDNRRTINFGFGYRAILNDWLAFHLDARNHMFDLDILGTQKTNNNLEFHTGMTVFF